MMLQTSNLTKFYTINCTDIAPIFVVYIVTMQTPPTHSPDSFLLQVDSGRLVQVKLMDALHQPAVRTLSLVDTHHIACFSQWLVTEDGKIQFHVSWC